MAIIQQTTHVQAVSGSSIIHKQTCTGAPTDYTDQWHFCFKNNFCSHLCSVLKKNVVLLFLKTIFILNLTLFSENLFGSLSVSVCTSMLCWDIKPAWDMHITLNISQH